MKIYHISKYHVLVGRKAYPFVNVLDHKWGTTATLEISPFPLRMAIQGLAFPFCPFAITLLLLFSDSSECGHRSLWSRCT